MYSSVLDTSNQKKAFFVLLCSIFYYHDMEDSKQRILADFSLSLSGQKELDWASQFVKQDILSSFTRSRTEVRNLLAADDKGRIEVLGEVWEATKKKGYITEMEANLMLGLARDWNMESDLINLVRSTN